MRTIVKSRHFARQVGFTLVELMIALVIGVLVLLGLVIAFDSNRESFRFNTQLLQLQDGGRLAMDAIIHDLRMAGDVGCVRSAMDGESGFDDIAGNLKISDTISATGGFWSDSDANKLMVLGVRPESGNNSLLLHIYGIPIIDSSNNAVLWSDCDRSEVTSGVDPSFPASYRVPTGYRTYVYRDESPTNDVAGTDLRKNQLRVRDPIVGNDDGVVLLDNVMGFAVCFGFDGDAGAMKGRVDEWIPNPPDNTDLPDDTKLQQVIAVRVQMVVASEPQGAAGTTGQVLSVDDSNPTIYDFCDGNSFTADSGTGLKRLYKFFSSTAVLRNKVPNGYGEGGWLEATN